MLMESNLETGMVCHLSAISPRQFSAGRHCRQFWACLTASRVLVPQDTVLSHKVVPWSGRLERVKPCTENDAVVTHAHTHHVLLGNEPQWAVAVLTATYCPLHWLLSLNHSSKLCQGLRTSNFTHHCFGKPSTLLPHLHGCRQKSSSAIMYTNNALQYSLILQLCIKALQYSMLRHC